MKDKIITKATEMFLKVGFKSITMDDIACEMCISKKTIYKYFANKEILIEESTQVVQQEIQSIIESIVAKKFNAIAENFEIRRMFKELFKSTETSPLYQLKKHYPEIHGKVINNQTQECENCFRQNITKGIEQGLYRNDLNIETSIKFYYTLIFSINENTRSEREAFQLEMEALDYHTRAIATPKGIKELEKQLQNSTI